mmetsp:Transcript_85153/g.244424  ORF Transcript_85153/g.244424 Transcript_85153/m.244424 type:complete len:231 (+) Transcript_85153:319-1011(+)
MAPRRRPTTRAAWSRTARRSQSRTPLGGAGSSAWIASWTVVYRRRRCSVWPPLGSRASPAAARRVSSPMVPPARGRPTPCRARMAAVPAPPNNASSAFRTMLCVASSTVQGVVLCGFLSWRCIATRSATSWPCLRRDRHQHCSARGETRRAGWCSRKWRSRSTASRRPRRSCSEAMLPAPRMPRSATRGRRGRTSCSRHVPLPPTASSSWWTSPAARMCTRVALTREASC